MERCDPLSGGRCHHVHRVHQTTGRCPVGVHTYTRVCAVGTGGEQKITIGARRQAWSRRRGGKMEDCINLRHVTQSETQRVSVTGSKSYVGEGCFEVYHLEKISRFKAVPCAYDSLARYLQ